MLGAVVLLYAPVALLGRSLQAPLYYPPGTAASDTYGYAVRRPVNVFDVDLATPAFYEWPINLLVGKAYRQGELPLWNPYQAAGTPLAAQYSTRVFFPYQILIDVSPVSTWDFYFLGRLWIAGLFTFLFLKSLGVSRASGVLGALCYMFSGTFVWFINLEQLVNVAMVAPALLWAIESVWQWRSHASIVAVAVSVALVLLAGQPETALFVLLMGTSYVVYRLARTSTRERLQKLIIALGGGLLGFSLAMPLLLPFFELERTSYNIHPPGGPMGVQDPAKVQDALAIVIPTLYQQETSYRFLPDNGQWDWLGGYLGVAPACLCALGLALVWRDEKNRWRRPMLFFAIFGSLTILKNFGFPPVSWIGYLPLLNQAWSPRWAGPIWTLAYAIVAALGAQALHDNKDEMWLKNNLIWWERQCRRAPRAVFSREVWRTAVICFCMAILLVSMLWIWWHLHLREGRSYLLVSVVLGTVSASIIAGSVLATMRHMHDDNAIPVLCGIVLLDLWFAIPWGYDSATQCLRIFPLLVGLVSLSALARRRYKLAIAGAIAAMGLFLCIDLTAQHGLPQRWFPQKVPPHVSWLQRWGGEARVAGVNGALMPNYASAKGLYDIRYVNALTQRTFHDFRTSFLHTHLLSSSKPSDLWFTGLPSLDIQAAGGPARITVDVGAEIQSNLAFYSLLGVKYFVTPRGYHFDVASAAHHSFSTLYEREVKIYENPDVIPRAFIVYQVEQAQSYQDAQRRLAESDFDLRQRVVLEEPLPEWNRRPIPVSEQAVELSPAASITSYRLDGVSIDARTTRDGVLILTDVYAPGWMASVDARPAKVLRVDGLFRGVFLKRGDHTVRFWYAPESFSLGFGAAVFCGSVCLVLLAMATRTSEFR